MDNRLSQKLTYFALLMVSLFAIASVHAQHISFGIGFGTGYYGGYPYRAQYFHPYPPPVIIQQPIIQAPLYAVPSHSYYPVNPIYSVPPAPMVLREAPETQKPSVWYFCESANNFYPNVSTCPEGWKEVSSNPAAPMSSVPPDSSQ
jgi:hypothetical protein